MVSTFTINGQGTFQVGHVTSQLVSERCAHFCLNKDTAQSTVVSKLKIGKLLFSLRKSLIYSTVHCHKNNRNLLLKTKSVEARVNAVMFFFLYI